MSTLAMSRFPPDVSPSFPPEKQPDIGLIGMGKMGKLYAKRLSEAGWKKINVCDKPENYESLNEQMNGMPGVHVMKDGRLVSRSSDFIMYSVEAASIDRVVAEYGPSTKVGAIVAGQTSVKAPEQKAFESHLPKDVYIFSCHSLHGSTVSTVGQPLQRSPDWALHLVEAMLHPLGSRYVYLGYENNDSVLANTQLAVTHAALLSMGTAWTSLSLDLREWLYYSGTDVARVNIMYGICSHDSRVSAEVVALNHFARRQIEQYATSTKELFEIMLTGNKDRLHQRLKEAREEVFSPSREDPIITSMLEDELLKNYRLGKNPATRKLSPLPLLAMVDSWGKLGIKPYDHFKGATPVFCAWVGVVEYLFNASQPARLETAISEGVEGIFRREDLEFTLAVHGWSQCISSGNFKLYEDRFEKIATFFRPQVEEVNTESGRNLVDEMIKKFKPLTGATRLKEGLDAK